MFAHLQRLHFAFHDGQQTGQLMSRANNDLQQIQNFIVLIPLTISNLVTVAGRAASSCCGSTSLLTVLALGLLPFVNVLAKRFSTQLHPTMLGVQQESAELAGVVEETVVGRPGREGLRRRGRAGGSGSARRPTTSTRSRWRRPGSGPATGRPSSCCRTSV